jgi:hypothetical protein
VGEGVGEGLRGTGNEISDNGPVMIDFAGPTSNLGTALFTDLMGEGGRTAELDLSALGSASATGDRPMTNFPDPLAPCNPFAEEEESRSSDEV